MTSLFVDAQRRYDDAVTRRAELLTEWETLGRPFTELGGATGRSLVAHPMVKMLNELDALCDRLARPLAKAHRGPAPSAVVAPTLSASPAQKLRAVRSAS